MTRLHISPTMKTKTPRPAAFFNFRVLAASLLFLTAGMFTLFALAGAQPDKNTQTIRSSRWLTRLASTLGIMSQSQPSGAVKLDKYPAERPPGETQPPVGPYTGPVRNLRPVTAVRTAKLRDMRPIPTWVELSFEPVAGNARTTHVVLHVASAGRITDFRLPASVASFTDSRAPPAAS